jgi:hypothetical protein
LPLPDLSADLYIGSLLGAEHENSRLNCSMLL